MRGATPPRLRYHTHRHVHTLRQTAAQDHAVQRHDVSEVGAPAEGDVAPVRELVVDRVELDPAVARKRAATQACEASTPIRRGMRGGGSVSR
jgi:hypothetical protein